MDEIFQQNANIVYRFLYSMCRDENLAEDLTQETFLKAIESIQRFDESCKISTWLCQIAKHLLYQHWTSCNHYSFVELDEKLEAGNNTELQAMNRMELSDIWSKVQSLPNKMKQVVEFRLLSEFSFKEIGEMLGKSENWARVTFFRAKIIMVKDSE